MFKKVLIGLCVALTAACSGPVVDTGAGDIGSQSELGCEALSQKYCDLYETNGQKCIWSPLGNKCVDYIARAERAKTCSEVSLEDCNSVGCMPSAEGDVCTSFCTTLSIGTCQDDRYCSWVGGYSDSGCVFRDECNGLDSENLCIRSSKCKWISQVLNLSKGGYCKPNCLQYQTEEACNNGSFRCKWGEKDDPDTSSWWGGSSGDEPKGPECRLIGYPKE